MSSQSGASQHYRIKSVSETTGLSTHVIRKWEERYHLIHPRRGPNGYRLFTEEDIQFLLYLKSQLDNGESIGQLAQSGEHELKRAMQHLPLDLSGIPHEYRDDARTLIRYASLQNIQSLTALLQKWINRMGLETALHTVIFPLLHINGELWHQGRISLRGEQSFSWVVRQHLIQVLREKPPREAPYALVACMQGDFHEIGPLTTAIFLREVGWHSIYLGPNVSMDILELALRRNHAKLIILGCHNELREKMVHAWLKDAAHRLLPSCTVMVGGAGFIPFTQLLSEGKIPFLQHVQDVKGFSPRTVRCGITNIPHQSSSTSPIAQKGV